MEITVKVVLSADANFLAVLQSLAGQNSVTQTTVWKEPNGENTEGLPATNGETGKNLVDFTKVTKTKKEKIAKETTAPADNAPHTITVTDPVETTHTLESLREMAIPLSKTGHKDAIQAKTRELGLTTIAHLQPAQFDEFHAFLQTLK